MRCSVIAYNSLLYLIFLSYTQLFLAISSSITHFVYKIDPLIAEQARQDINNYIEHIPKKELLSFCELTDKIEKEFSFVKEIIIEKIAPNIVSITCKAHQPLGLINESFILIKQGSLHNKDIFLSPITDQLPHISLPSLETSIIESILTVINRIDPVIFAQFTLSWINDTQVCLYDKKHRQFSIIFSKNQLLDKKLFNYCTQIRQKLQKEKFTKNKKNYVADIRFKDQIVVYRG